MDRKVLKNTIVSFLVYVFANMFISSILVFLAGMLGIKDGIILDLIMVLSAILTLVVMLVYSKDKLKNQFENFKKNIKKNLKTVYGTWLVGFALMIIANLVINVLVMNGIAPNEEANREILFQYPIYSIIDMCIIAPIIEEIIFRLNLKGIFKSKNAYILTSGLLFGFMHVISGFSLANLIYLIPYSILGFTFAKIFYETDSVAGSSLAHITHNTLSVIVIFLGV